jgi:NAD(P)H dehydrogenase (quinone)
MVDNGSILVTGAAGQLGSVGRTVTGLLLDQGFPVRAMVRREDERAASLRAAGAQVVVGDLLEPVMFIASSPAAAGSTSACPCPLGTSRRP